MYIISAKYKYKFQEEYEWGYVGHDNHSGSISTGYPCWDSENYAKKFETVEEAKKWWAKNNQYLLCENYEILLDTIAIRKKIYKTIEKLS